MCSPRYSPWGFPQDIHADLSSHTSLLDLYWFWQFIQTKFCFWTPPEKFHSLVELVVHLLSFLPQRGCSGRSRSALLPQQTVLIGWLSFFISLIYIYNLFFFDTKGCSSSSSALLGPNWSDRLLFCFCIVTFHFLLVQRFAEEAL